MDFTKMFQLMGLKPKSKGHMNVYEYCDLTKKVYLMYIVLVGATMDVPTMYKYIEKVTCFEPQDR